MSSGNIFQKCGSDHPIYRDGWLANTRAQPRRAGENRAPDEPDVEITIDKSKRLTKSQDDNPGVSKGGQVLD